MLRRLFGRDMEMEKFETFRDDNKLMKHHCYCQIHFMTIRVVFVACY